MAAERSAAALNEPDRLDGFSAPREVDRLFGHQAAISEFSDALASGRMHHAWLLVGPEGIGKATLAYRFARAALTEGGDQAAAPRDANAFLGHSAGEAGWRVVIVDRVDELNQNAANALLKALEEPPPKTLFLLISSAEGRLPVTIRSRSRTLRVTALGDEDLAGAVRAALARDGHEADAKTLATAVALSQGSVRRALELVSSAGIELYGEILAALSALPEIDGARLHRLVDRLAGGASSDRLDLYLSLLLGLIERLVRFAATGEGATQEEQKLAKGLVSRANLAQWADAWEAMSEAKAEAQALNLDRGLLLLETWFRLQQVAREHPI